MGRQRDDSFPHEEIRTYGIRGISPTRWARHHAAPAETLARRRDAADLCLAARHGEQAGLREHADALYQRAATVAMQQGLIERALAVADAAATAAAQCGRIAWASEAALVAVDALRRQGRVDDARVRLEAGLAQARTHGDHRGTLALMEVLVTDAGRLNVAGRHARELLRRARRMGAGERVAEALNHLGLLEQYRGRCRGAVRRYEQALDLATANSITKGS